MNTNTPKEDSRHRKRFLVTIILALIVFCFWQFGCPWLLLAREGNQLFLWDSSYFLDRLVVPGGLARYIGEIIVQFFIIPPVAAIIYALLFVAEQQLTQHLLGHRDRTIWWILSFVPSVLLWVIACFIDIPMTTTVAILLTMVLLAVLSHNPRYRMIITTILIPVAYWLLGPAVIILAVSPLWSGLRRMESVGSAIGEVLILTVCIVGSSFIVPYPLGQIARGIDYYWAGKETGTSEEMEYDMLMRKEAWDVIAEKYQQNPSERLAVQNVATLAQFYSGQISEQDFLHRLRLSGHAFSSISAAFITSELSLHLRLTNMSQRAAFEVMEAIPNYGMSGRAVQRLVETNLVTGSYEVAQKYIELLEHTTFYRPWAERMQQLAEHPEQIRSISSYRKLQDVYNQSPDVFFY